MFGGNGGLGTDIQAALKKDGYGVFAPRSFEVDVRNSSQIDEYVKNKPTDALIYLAGTTKSATVHKTTQDEVIQEVSVNSLGFLTTVRAVLPFMREQGYGRIIYVSSVLAKRPIIGTSVYSASKCFSESIVRSVALENARRNVTANTIRLGYSEKGMIEKVPSAVLTTVVESVPMQRLGTTKELYIVIKSILHNEFMTGAEIDLSGGLHL